MGMGEDSYRKQRINTKFYVKLTKHKWHKTSNGTIMVWRDYKEEVFWLAQRLEKSNKDAHEEV